MCAGRQALRWFFHGYGPGLDRGEPVGAVGVGEAAADAGEVRVDRGRVLVALVDVAAAGVGLPDLDELVPHRPAVAVEDPAGDDHPLADRLAAVLDGQVGLERVDVAVPEHRRPQLDPLGVGVVQVLGRVPQHAAAVRRVVQPRLRLAVARGGRGLGVLARDARRSRRSPRPGSRRPRRTRLRRAAGCVVEDVGHGDDGRGDGPRPGVDRLPLSGRTVWRLRARAADVGDATRASHRSR